MFENGKTGNNKNTSNVSLVDKSHEAIELDAVLSKQRLSLILSRQALTKTQAWRCQTSVADHPERSHAHQELTISTLASN
jgi:hypothetical protein